ncbi:PREDICTED: uncharacterized protein LOC106319371 isoform X4 [Brassica oleracea var. oleracea]|uniref:uncharacterized protein LOC106319371 isoform X4 n=1 Tax=Brassica oleracea var. oleracea TaxID=109376 RepID=UPI0006A6D2FD|nr:PREDICTED: uncharacterized protein LOC106319371 isoform X4 [Brassica oleracea var. oleracea]
MEIEEGAKVPLFLLQLCFDSMENRFMCSSSHQQERNGCGYTCRATCCGERATCCGERATCWGRHLSHERCGVTTAMVAIKRHT